MIDLKTLPVAQAYAERMAREWYATYRAIAAGPLLLWRPSPWESFSDVEKEHHAGILLDLLCRLDRPESRDAWVRLLNERPDDRRRAQGAGGPRDSLWPDDYRDNPEALRAVIERVFGPKQERP